MRKNRLFNSTLFSGSALGLTFLMSPTSIANTIYNAADDFSATNNPNGVWQYGHETGTISGAPDVSTFVDFGAEIPGSSLAPTYTGLQIWYTGSNIDPNIIHNSGASTISDGSNTWLPNELTLGPFGGPTDVRFTAAIAGSYDISALFSPSQTVNSIPIGYVYINGVQVFAQPADGTNPYASTLVPLGVGGTIDFIAYGGNANNKTTRLDATVTLVPEPTTLGLTASVGSLAMLARRRRKA